MKDEFVLDLRKTNGWPSEVEQRIGRSQEESMRSEEQVPKRTLGPSAGAPCRLRSMGSLFGRQQCTACKLEDATPSQVTTVETGGPVPPSGSCRISQPERICHLPGLPSGDQDLPLVTSALSVIISHVKRSRCESCLYSILSPRCSLSGTTPVIAVHTCSSIRYLNNVRPVR
jgi:hypothetical protein